MSRQTHARSSPPSRHASLPCSSRPNGCLLALEGPHEDHEVGATGNPVASIKSEEESDHGGPGYKMQNEFSLQSEDLGNDAGKIVTRDMKRHTDKFSGMRIWLRSDSLRITRA